MAPTQIDRFLRSLCTAGRIPGACWAVERLDAVRLRGAVGQAALEPTPRPVDPSLAYDLASLTKPLATALLLVMLEHEGVLELETPASTWLEELRGTSWQRATLTDLAGHRAGLPSWRPLYLRARDPAEYVAAIAEERAEVAPGEILYSDLGYILLGVVIERATGESLDRLFERRVAEPLGRPGLRFATAFDADRTVPTERGNAYERSLVSDDGGYRWRTEVIRGEPHDANAHGLQGVAGHSGLFGTLDDVVAMAHELLRPKRLLPSPARRRLFEPLSGERRTVGFVLARASRAARGILPDSAPGHVGFTGTSLWLDPVREELMVLLTNRVHPTVHGDFQPLRRGFHRLATRLLRDIG